MNQKLIKKRNNRLVICEYCHKLFEGNNRRFCQNTCRDAYIVDLEKRIIQATDMELSHTNVMIKDL